jgi:nucleotide sugar dehydrogenase
MPNIEPILVPPDSTLKNAMQVIDAAPHKGSVAGIALVVDNQKRLLGVLTDGDIRRALLKGIGLSSPVSQIMTKEPITVNSKLSANQMLSALSERLRERSTKKGPAKVEKLVVVDDDNKVVDVVSLFDIWRRSEVKFRQIVVVGLGFVGLTLAVSLADIGYKVIGIDNNMKVVESLKKGIPHIHEVGLDSLLSFHIGKNFHVKTAIEESEGDVYVMCIQTPVDKEKRPVLRYLEDATRSVGKVLKRDDMVIVRSTVPVGTTRNTIKTILERESGLAAGKDFSLVSAPERTIAGKALKELRELPQIIGGIDNTSRELAANIFRKLTPTIVNVESPEAAELIKLIDNTYRDVTFAYANEIALVCDRFGIDSTKIVRAANEGYARNRIPVPSPGVGGVCLKKDPYIFMNTSSLTGYAPKMVKVAREINEGMVSHIASKVNTFFDRSGKEIHNSKIFLMGFAFKGIPETSDTRDSTTLDVVATLLPSGAKLYGYDPVVSEEEIKSFNVVPVTVKDGFKDADCVLIMNNHDSYSKLDIYSLLSTTKKPCYFFDGWSLFEKEAIERVEGIKYDSISSYG